MATSEAAETTEKNQGDESSTDGMNRLRLTGTPERTISIDPAGDVVFSIDGTALQVSSKVLCVASAYFRAMFGPNFSEGRSLLQRCVLFKYHTEQYTELLEQWGTKLAGLPSRRGQSCSSY